MELILAPKKLHRLVRPAIFLAGSIEMGQAIEWQDYVAQELKDYPITLLNPRREHWGFKWSKTVNDRKFKEQVAWEFNALSKSDYIILFFDPKSKSPISLLELGLFANNHKIFCCCPKKFWRYGNVKFVCEHFKIPLYHDLDKMLTVVTKYLK